MLHLLVDTSVWLDLAKRRDGQRLIVPIRVLWHQNKLELLVPPVVRDEFERNRPRAEAAVAQAVKDRFRLLRKDLQDYGGDVQHAWLDEMAHQVPMVSAMTLQNFSEIAELLDKGRKLEPSEAEYARVVQRGLLKRAPFHLQKNSTADALLIELYDTAQAEAGSADYYCFVTSNYQDFSRPNGDRRQPHPDLAQLFAGHNSQYCYEVAGLEAALQGYFGDEFLELAEETEILAEEPRTFSEIISAERAYFDKVWYIRSLIHLEKIEDRETDAPVPEIMERMREAMRVIEERYGAENIGPWDDWEWGFVNGKLSALRWVLGSEWDFLDT